LFLLPSSLSVFFDLFWKGYLIVIKHLYWRRKKALKLIWFLDLSFKKQDNLYTESYKFCLWHLQRNLCRVLCNVQSIPFLSCCYYPRTICILAILLDCVIPYGTVVLYHVLVTLYQVVTWQIDCFVFVLFLLLLF